MKENKYKLSFVENFNIIDQIIFTNEKDEVLKI